jgi:uncharacterized protein (TIGR03086 family)
MDEPIGVFLAAQRAFGDRVHAIAEAQWSAPTPDAEWTVADLVAHLIDEHRWLPPLMHGLDLTAAGEVVAGTRDLPVDGGVGANLAESWDEAAIGSADAVVEPEALKRSVELSSGPTPARDYLREMTTDLIVHAWDLGTALGLTDPLPDDLVAFALAEVNKWGDMSGTSYFGAPVPVSDDAPAISKLVAATGRNPMWSAN